MAITVEELPIDKMELDLNNPRIAQFVEMHGDNIPGEQIALALGTGDTSEQSSGSSFISLRASIRTNGGIIHPIIVNHVKNKYVVIEGNTRVAIYRDFLENEEKGNWDKIIAIVYENMSPVKIDSIRLQAHLVGPREWDPYSKAKYLDYLSNSEHLPINEIIDYCGGRESEIRNYIQAYKDMEKYYRPLVDDQDFDQTRFSAFVELQRTSMRQAIVNNNFNYKDFAQWIHDQKIYPLLSVRSLPAVLNNEKSRKIFINYRGRRAIQEAEKVLSRPTPEAQLKEATLEALADEIIKRVLNMPFSEFQEMSGDSSNETLEAVIKARNQLIQFCDSINIDND